MRQAATFVKAEKYHQDMKARRNNKNSLDITPRATRILAGIEQSWGSSFGGVLMIVLLLSLLVLFFVGPPCLVAQQGRGTISGTVSDPSGAAVPEASVTITNVRTNAVFTTQTNEEGLDRKSVV